MNIRVLGVACCLAFAGVNYAQDVANIPLNTPTVVERGIHQRVWKTIIQDSDEQGISQYRTNSFVELQSGICYQENGKWYDSVEEIELHPDGAVARRGPHKVIFAPNLNTVGAIDVLTPSGQRILTTPVGLAYRDASSGAFVWLGGIKDCKGELLGNNQVIYPNAVSNINCTLRYTYTKAGVEQDCVLLEQPPAPETFGLNPDTTRLEVVTELHEHPEITRSVTELKSYPQYTDQRTGKQITLSDETAQLGDMFTGHGRAFKLAGPTEEDPGVPVAKRVTVSGDRTFLIEAVEYNSISPYTTKLPENKSTIRTGQIKTSQEVFPPKSPVRKERESLMTAQTSFGKDPGFVIDYQLMQAATNFTFKGDTTYYVSGFVMLWGTSTFEGGAVIKYTNDFAQPFLDFGGNVKTEATPYRPVVFTAKDDDTVGEPIPGSTGSPSGYYASPYMWLYGPNCDFKHMRFRYGHYGIQTGINKSHTLTDVQFYKVGTVFQVLPSTFTLRNALFDQCYFMSVGTNCTIYAENVTFNQLNRVSSDALTNSSSIYFTNCIFSRISNPPLGNIYTSNCVTNGATSGFFESVLAGNFYLANDTCRNQGTTNINTNTLNLLRQYTTYAPQFLSNTVISVDTVMGPRVQRDTDVPDIGYHYPPLDYIVYNLQVTNACLTLTNGVAMGMYYWSGINLYSGGRLVSEGSPVQMNHITRLHTVQEQPLPYMTNTYMFLVGCFNYSDVRPSVRMRFTDITCTADGDTRTFFIRNPNPLAPCELVDCQLRGVGVYMNPTYGDSRGETLLVTNCLFHQVRTSLGYGYGGDTTPLSVHFRNTTFKGGSISMSINSTDTGAYSLCDNVFDQVNAWFNYLGGTWTNACNAYYTTTALPNSVTNITLSSVNWQKGPLGDFYLWTNSPAIDAGSRYANDAGLYHYTTLTNQTKEASTAVDLGYHYVAVDANGLPLDQDGDGMPDYAEDRNGNGIYDASNWETDWMTSNSGMGTVNALQVYTPFKP